MTRLLQKYKYGMLPLIRNTMQSSFSKILKFNSALSTLATPVTWKNWRELNMNNNKQADHAILVPCQVTLPLSL